MNDYEQREQPLHAQGRNRAFVAYFQDSENEEGFLANMCSLPATLRQEIYDHYLYFLDAWRHTETEDPRLLISTSDDRDVALQSHRLRADNTLSYLFVPESGRGNCVSGRLPPAVRDMLSALKTPHYTSTADRNAAQQTHYLRPKALPQLSLGVHELASGRFIVNPHLLKMREDQIGVLPRDGIPVVREGK
jgi:hypothetical protein